MPLYNQLVHVRTHWNWTYFPRPDPRSVAPCGHVAHALGVCTLRPPAAAASGTVAVFAFALKAVVQSTFIYRLRRTAALSVRLEYRPSLSALSMVHIRVSECRMQYKMSGCAVRMGAPQQQK